MSDKPKDQITGADSPMTDDLNASELLARAQRAFEAGDYRTVRELTRRPIASGDAKTAAAARELLRRVSVNRIHFLALLLCFAALCIIAYIYLR